MVRVETSTQVDDRVSAQNYRHFDALLVRTDAEQLKGPTGEWRVGKNGANTSAQSISVAVLCVGCPKSFSWVSVLNRTSR